MTEPEPPPLDADLAALFAEERASHTFDDARLAKLARRVETAVAIGARSTGIEAPKAKANELRSPSTLPGVAPWKAAIAVALAFGLGVAVGVSRGAFLSPSDVADAGSPPAPSATLTTTTSPLPGALSPSASAPEPAVDAAPHEPAPHASSTPPDTSTRAAPSATSTLAEEQALVDRARAALSRGRPKDALAAVTEHERRFGRGRLAEEREILAIQALVADGRTTEARTRAARFRTTFPKSLFLPSLGKIVGDP